MEENEETESLILKRTLTEASVIVKPFHHSISDKYSVWRHPMFSRPAAERHGKFDWFRPKTERQTLVETAARYQAEELKKVLRQKEIETRLMAKQLLRINKENYSLLKELEGYRGKKYDELYQENMALKHNVSRTSRENVILAGKIRRDDNRSLRVMRNKRPQTAN